MTTELKPIRKKTYVIPDRTKKIVEINGLSDLFREYLASAGCLNLLQLVNKFSRADGILSSGFTDNNGERKVIQIVVEYKERMHSVADYSTTIIEKTKFLNLKELSTLMNAPAFYICSFNEAVLIWQLNFNEEMQEDIITMPLSYKSASTGNKYIYHLDYKDTSIIIGKNGKNGKWERATADQLLFYINKMKNGNN